jgi:hypothetical protein
VPASIRQSTVVICPWIGVTLGKKISAVKADFEEAGRL